MKIAFATSMHIYNECPFLQGKLGPSFKSAVDVYEVTETELNSVKSELKAKGVKMVAQDPDLTLIALADRLTRAGKAACIVSDDYKLSENVRLMQKFKIKFLSLPAFLQYIWQNVSADMKDYFALIRKNVLKNNLDYMMSRHDQFPAQEKIVWLIENAVNVAGEGISISGTTTKMDTDESHRYFQIMEDYVMDKMIAAKHKEEIKALIPNLDRNQKSQTINQTR